MPDAVPAIALDASLWDEPVTGISLYARNLARALESLGVPVRKIGARQSGDDPRGDQSRTAFTLLKLPGLLASAPEPVFHAVGNFNLPLTRVPGKRLVLTVHDVIPLLLPSTVSVPYRWQFRVWLARSLRVADKIICVSERTRQDLLGCYDIPLETLSVVHHGVDHVDRIPAPDATSEAFIRSLALPSEFVLYAGSLDIRKNLKQLLEALARLKARGRVVSAVIVGQKWFGSEAVEERLVQVRSEGCDVRVLDHQSDAVFYALMKRASLFVFPSLYEGFGLPPLEAMRLGIPVVASTGGALPEILGDAASAVTSDDPEGLAARIERLLDSPEERKVLASAGKRRAASFTWEAAARRTLDVYREAIRAPAAA